MMTYVDGFVLAVPTANKERYIEHARSCVPVFKKYGAVRCVENWGVNTPVGQVTSFPRAVQMEEGETVLFSWIIWPSKDARDKGMEELIKDPFFDSEEEFSIFDPQRMLIGGFETIVDE